MSLSVGASTHGHWFARPLRLYRLGDVALSMIWVIFGTGGVLHVLADVRDQLWLAAAHNATATLILFLNALLFILRRPAVAGSEGWRPKLIAIVGTGMLGVVAVLPLTWTPDWLLATTTVGLIAANVWVIWSLATLRRSFSIFPEARALVRHGPYALVRHPLYATYIAMYVLVVLPRFGPVALAMAAFGIACEVWRARYEERVLRATFPDYDAYAAVTPRFLPRLLGLRPRA